MLENLSVLSVQRVFTAYKDLLILKFVLEDFIVELDNFNAIFVRLVTTV